MEVPYVDLSAEYASMKDELDEATSRVLESGVYILGDESAAFEREFAAWAGARAARAVNSGTDAIYLTLKALGVGAGDEVITVSHTAVNTALAISKTDAKPVFVDVDPETFCLDPDLLVAAITDRTRLVLPVHLYGHPADMGPLMEVADARGLSVVEDCAQAHGAAYRGMKVGTMGIAGCFSFYPTKNLGACGDGGAVITDNEELAAKIGSLANCGQGEERYLNLYQGDVSRMDEVQAAVLRVKLRHLDELVERRREIAAAYGSELSETGLELPRESSWARHVYHLYVVRSKQRDRLRQHLLDRGVQALVHYPVPVHRQPAYMNDDGMQLPQTERLVEEILSLPVFPQMKPAQLEHVVQAVKDFQL